MYFYGLLYNWIQSNYSFGFSYEVEWSSASPKMRLAVQAGSTRVADLILRNVIVGGWLIFYQWHCFRGTGWFYGWFETYNFLEGRLIVCFFFVSAQVRFRFRVRKRVRKPFRVESIRFSRVCAGKGFTLSAIKVEGRLCFKLNSNLWWFNSLLLKMAIEIVSFPMKNGDFP